MEYLTDAIAAKVLDERIPFDTTFELTRRCNLSCGMCYLPHNTCSELDTAAVKLILSKLKATGCLFCTFTGGELFIRPDTLDIIDYATDLGFAVTVKTNGMLVDRTIVTELARCNVMEVHISLLAASAAAHDGITGVTGSFDAACRAATLLREAGITVVAMSVVTRGTVDDMRETRHKAHQLGIDHVAFSAIIFPRFPGDTSAHRFRLTDEELGRFYRTTAEFAGNDEDAGNTLPEEPDDERLLSCTALQSGITIAPDGTVFACSSIPLPLGNIVTDPLDAMLFSADADRIIEGLRLSAAPECAACADRFACLRCPGLAFLDEGAWGHAPHEACRHNRIFKTVVTR